MAPPPVYGAPPADEHTGTCDYQSERVCYVAVYFWRVCEREETEVELFQRVFPNILRLIFNTYILVGGCCGETLGLKAILWNVVYSVCLLVCSVTCAFGVANSDWVSNSAVSFQLSVSFFPSFY